MRAGTYLGVAIPYCSPKILSVCSDESNEQPDKATRGMIDSDNRQTLSVKNNLAYSDEGSALVDNGTTGLSSVDAYQSVDQSFTPSHASDSVRSLVHIKSDDEGCNVSNCLIHDFSFR